MPEYLAPGVYVEETSYRAKSIEGVSTTTTGFVGPTRYGPTDRPSDVITSLVEFERIYGGREPLKFGAVDKEVETPNFMWHAARAFFEEGGKRLYVARVYTPLNGKDGCASQNITSPSGSPPPITISARFPGQAGNYIVSFAAVLGQNILITDKNTKNVLRGLTEYDVVQITKGENEATETEVQTVVRNEQGEWAIETANRKSPAELPKNATEVRVVTLKVTVTQPDTGNQRVWTGLAPDSRHRRSGTPDSLFATFPKDLVNSSQAASIPIWIGHQDGTDKSDAKGIDVLRALGCLKTETRSLGDTTLGEITLNGKRLDQFTLAQVNYHAINPADGSSKNTPFSQMKASEIETPQLNQVFNSGSITLQHLMLDDKQISEITLGQIKLGDFILKDIQLDDINLGSSQLRSTDSPKKTLANTKLANKDFGLINLNDLQLGGNSISSLPVSVTGTHDKLDTILLGDIKLGGRKLSSIKLRELTVTTVAFSDLQLEGIPLFASDKPFEKVSTEEQSFCLKDGTDGNIPTASDIAGQSGETGTNGESLAKSGLKGFEDIEDISIVAAPGSTWTPDPSKTTDAQAACNALIRHAQKMKYRIAVLDSPKGASIQEVREFRAKFDSSHAALYYPWVRTLDPATNTDILLPPSGFVAGIYARNDINRAVYKAPANEVVTLALGFEHTLNQAHQEVLNPEGINCFRYFEGRGNRLWGARTVSSDSEWKYVNLRRYFAYLERSIDRSSQFAVFEPNGEALWANIRRMVEDFLFSEWQSGALLGDKPEKAFFVRCDRSTMNQNDLDNGRLVCLIGVAPLRPAEFVIFRIGQFTADRR